MLWQAHLGWVLVVVAGCCRPQGEKQKPAENEAQEPTAVAPTSPRPNSGGWPDSAAGFFEGRPAAEVEFAKTAGSVLRVRVPKGWRLDDNFYEGMSFLQSPSDNVRVIVHNVGKGPVSDANVHFWMRVPLGTGNKKATLEPWVNGRLGTSGLEGEATKGNGLIFGTPAAFYVLRLQQAGTGFLVMMGVKANASDQEKQQGLAAVRSVTLK